MIRRPPRSTQSRSSAASDVYKRQLGATIGIVLHLSNLPWMAVLALIGGFLTLGVVWMAARRRGRIDIFVLLLAGVTISYLASAVVTVLMIRASQDMHAIVYWLMGSFSGLSLIHISEPTRLGMI